jgi:HEAT repeat protein
MAASTEIDEICQILSTLGAFEACRPSDVNFSSPLGIETKRAISRLRALAAEGRPEVRMAAAVALSKVTGETESLIGALISGIRESDEMVRSTAILAIGQLRSSAGAAVPMLI